MNSRSATLACEMIARYPIIARPASALIVYRDACACTELY
jgi:hypothetical protein